jgi:hypothetical protein
MKYLFIIAFTILAALSIYLAMNGTNNSSKIFGGIGFLLTGILFISITSKRK